MHRQFRGTPDQRIFGHGFGGIGPLGAGLLGFGLGYVGSELFDGPGYGGGYGYPGVGFGGYPKGPVYGGYAYPRPGFGPGYYGPKPRPYGW